MKFALHFGNNTFPDAANAMRLARLAETAGFDTVFAVDHVLLPDSYESTYPYAASGRLPGDRTAPMPDPLIWMAFAAAVTTKLRLQTGVIILPLRDPCVLAKQVATLDFMSGGRIDLGVGVGWLREEFDALGVPFTKRGRMADEYIGAMRALWRDNGAAFQGEFVKFEGMNCNPKPPRRAVPIIIGGHSEAAAKRAGRLGDGFFPSIGSQVDTLPLLDLVRRTAEAAGRDPGAIEMITGCPGALPGAEGDPVEAVAARAKLGVGQVVLPIGAFMPDLDDSLPRFGERVIRAYKGT